MMHARRGYWVVVAGLVAGCAAADSLSGRNNPSSADSLGDAGAGTPAADGKGGSAPAFGTPNGAPAANGVVLVHAAAFPSFRLCFENRPDLVPQPDSKIMPEANVVGVELGSVVRIDPLEQPVGKIYVISESEVRSSVGDPNEVKCGELLGNPSTTKTLTPDNDYHVIAEPINRALGDNTVQVLAITGCGSQAFLNALDHVASPAKASSANCGDGWDPTSGNLKAQIVELPTSNSFASDKNLPIQLFHMSPAIETFRAGGALTVTFGPLTGGPSVAPIPLGPLYSGGTQTSLAIDQTTEAIYGLDGFKISIAGTQPPFAVQQSLADIQKLSSPTELPRNYYRTASNYALMLLGDPAHGPTFGDGGVNPQYNPRRAVHLLAVPVLDPSQLDAGSDAAPPSPTTADAGGR